MRRLTPLLLLLLAAGAQEAKPSIVLIITDDQGYGDVGFHGNPYIHTPNIDALAGRSCRIDPFLVCPVCSPTRSSLLTGRYNYRTGIVDTFMGRSLMFSDELTLAEMLAPHGYRNGIFGKWHLGDNYPMRPQDQGFHDCFTIRGGGLGQPSDPPGGDHYTNATMYEDGKAIKTQGYCTDVITDRALKFIETNAGRPFFAYVAFNAPHTPLETPEGYLKPYQDAKLPETTAKVYAMVSNIDDNVGRIVKKLDDLNLAENTILIFMTDNGPQQVRFNGGLRGLKGTTYEGGIRVPFLFRWPRGLRQNRTVDVPFAHIDVVPTLLDALHLTLPAVGIDGISFLPWLRDKRAAPDRTLYFQWHRGDNPEEFRACAARETRWKAIWSQLPAKPQLFDLESDPAESTDVSGEHPDIVKRLTDNYSLWYHMMRLTRTFEWPRIIVGSPKEDPVILTRQDCRGFAQEGTGYWLVTVEKDVTFDVTLRFRAPGVKTTVTYKGGATPVEVPVESTATFVTLPAVQHGQGGVQLSGVIRAKKPYGVDYIELQQSGEKK